MVSKSLNVCCWNVNSLFNRVNGVRTNKLDDPLFLQSLNSEIIILTETHACKNDILTIDGYFCISNCRSEQPSRLRGGVAIFMKRNIKAGIKIIDISPASSGYTKRTGVDKILFQKLESDIVKFTPDNYVMIMGDINAHVNCNDLDFIINEESDVMEDSLPANYLIDNKHLLRNTAIHQ